jgi:hypothetical protein
VESIEKAALNENVKERPFHAALRKTTNSVFSAAIR